ncbi:MAG: hypothetical protein PVI91_07765 [Gammaproteobacteria bacterium]
MGRLAVSNDASARPEVELYARLGELNRKLVEADSARLALQGELERSEGERERVFGRDRERRAELQRRIGSLESERDAAWQRVRELESSLGRASERRAGIEDQLEQLHERLERERNELQAQLDGTHTALKRSQDEARQLHSHTSRLLEAMHQAQRLAEAGGDTARQLGRCLSDGSHLWRPDATSLSGGPAAISFASEPPKRGFRAREMLASPKLRLAAGLPLLLGALASGKAVWDGRDSAGLVGPPEQTVRPTAGLDPRRASERRAATVLGQGAAPTGQQRQFPPVAEEARADLAAMDAGTPGPQTGRGFDAALQRQQEDLLALGFDLGESRADGLMGVRTRQALKEFELLYLPVTGLVSLSDEAKLESLVRTVARRAREDGERLNMPSEVLAALQLSHLRTGAPFGYLAELAAVESRFDPETRSTRSTAAGLYQFTEDTWLQVVKAHGEKYGLGKLVPHIAEVSGAGHFDVGDPQRRQQILDLRYNARVSALMAAEFANDNRRKLAAALGRDIDATDLYFAHFLGPADAIAFLSLLQVMPEGTAAELFPEAARTNGRVFYSPEGAPRTVAEVYGLFERKFNTGRYQGWDPAVTLADIRG